MEALREESGALVLVTAVQHLEVRRVGSKVDAGGSGVEGGIAIGPGNPVPVGPVGALQLDLAGAFQLWSIRVARAFAVPEVEDPGRIPALLRSQAPVAGRQGAVPPPGPARHAQAAVTVARDTQEAHGRRLDLCSHRERELPPQPLDEAAASLRLDRLAQLLGDRADLFRARGRVVPDGGQP